MHAESSGFFGLLRNLTPPMTTILGTIPMSDFECGDYLLDSDVENTAKKVIEKAADIVVTVDHSQKPVR